MSEVLRGLGKGELTVMRKHKVASVTFGSFLFHDIVVADDRCEPLAIYIKDSLIFRVFQCTTGAQNGHDDNSLSEIRPIA